MIAPDKSRRRALPMISIMPYRLSRGTRSLGHERPGSRARRTTALDRASPLRGERGKVRNRRISLVAGRPGEGPLTEPHSRHSASAAGTALPAPIRAFGRPGRPRALYYWRTCILRFAIWRLGDTDVTIHDHPTPANCCWCSSYSYSMWLDARGAGRRGDRRTRCWCSAGFDHPTRDCWLDNLRLGADRSPCHSAGHFGDRFHRCRAAGVKTKPRSGSASCCPDALSSD